MSYSGQRTYKRFGKVVTYRWSTLWHSLTAYAQKRPSPNELSIITTSLYGGAENAGVENAGVENAGADCRVDNAGVIYA